VTAQHPVYSLDRGCFVAAGELSAGERLVTLAGPTAVLGIQPQHTAGQHTAGQHKPKTVYNLEVQGQHVFRLGKHGDFPTPRPTGTQSHHGTMSTWMRKHFAGYDANKAPAILMPTTNHQKTFGVYNTWRAGMKKRMAGTFDWGKVSETDMRALSEKMFDAAEVPRKMRTDNWDWFTRIKGAL